MEIHFQYFLPIIFSLAVFVFTFLIALVFTLADHRSKTKHDTKKDAGYYALKSKRLIWLISSMLWRMAYYICVLISFISSVTIVYISVEVSASSTDVLIFSIITTALVLFEFVIKPKEAATAHREAFFLADKALNEYTYGDHPPDPADAINKGEEIITKFFSG